MHTQKHTHTRTPEQEADEGGEGGAIAHLRMKGKIGGEYACGPPPNPPPHPHIPIGQRNKHTVYARGEGGRSEAGEERYAALDAGGDAAAEDEAAAVEVPEGGVT